MLANRRAKIVATIGPATSSKDNLKLAIESGMNVARLNFSHGQHSDHLAVIQNIRELSRELRAPVTVLQDLQGPKIRVGHFREGSITLIQGQDIEISSSFNEGTDTQVPSDYPDLHKVCEAGTRILLDDGLLELEVLSVNGDIVKARVVTGGILKNRKGMNLPGVTLPVHSLTATDLEALEFGLEHKVDYIAISFARRKRDIDEVRAMIMQADH